MNDEFEPQIVAFCCSNCAAAAENVADGMNKIFPGNVKVIQVPCTGRIEVLHLLRPFEEGADGVYVAGCQEDSCRYIAGIVKATKRVANVRHILEQLEIEPDRIGIFNLSAAKRHGFVEVAQEMIDKVKALGPSLVKIRS
jgi:coenzyme F420-reducing hydrogenase delta subunit